MTHAYCTLVLGLIGHTTPQPLQLLASLWVLTQTPPQLTFPAPQQRPDWQVSPAPTLLEMPQNPQWVLSVCKLTQAPPHTELESQQLLDAQVWLKPQVLPHAPQLSWSLVVLTHEPPQLVSAPQPLDVQPPLRHTWPFVHRVPQPPQ